jgi:hypothetical protein
MKFSNFINKFIPIFAVMLSIFSIAYACNANEIAKKANEIAEEANEIAKEPNNVIIAVDSILFDSSKFEWYVYRKNAESHEIPEEYRAIVDRTQDSVSVQNFGNRMYMLINLCDDAENTNPYLYIDALQFNVTCTNNANVDELEIMEAYSIVYIGKNMQIFPKNITDAKLPVKTRIAEDNKSYFESHIAYVRVPDVGMTSILTEKLQQISPDKKLYFWENGQEHENEGLKLKDVLNFRDSAYLVKSRTTTGQEDFHVLHMFFENDSFRINHYNCCKEEVYRNIRANAMRTYNVEDN